MKCQNCGNDLPEGAKFCTRCGKSVKQKKEVDIKAVEKTLKTTGSSVFAIGWLTVIVNVGLYIWSVLDTNYAESGLLVPDLSGLVLMLGAATVFIVLGNRIEVGVDKRIGRYLQILIVLSLAVLVWAISSGGRIGILFIIVLLYLISSSIALRKAMKAEEFSSKLTYPDYKLNKKGWFAAGVIFILILICASFFDLYHTSKAADRASDTVNSYFTDSSTWKEFHSPIGGFAVTFPTYPAHENGDLDIPGSTVKATYDSYTSTVGDTAAYIVYVSQYPSEVNTSNPKVNLEGSLNGMIASDPANKLVSSTYITFDGRTALDYVITNNDMNLKGRIITGGETMFALIASYPTNAIDSDGYNKFISSFTFE